MKSAVLSFALVALAFGLVVFAVNLRRSIINRRETRAARERRRWVEANKAETDREIAEMLKSSTARIAAAKRETWIAPELRIR